MQLSEAAPVSRAIYERLDAGASGFTVQVPQSFCSDGSRQRECSISELALVPGFFSQKAFQMGVESDAAERASGGPSQEYTLRFQITTEENLYHDVATGTVPNKYALPRKTAPLFFNRATSTFFCAPLRTVYLSPPVPLSVTQSNFKSNAELWQLLRGALRTLNGWTNLSVSVSYQTGDRKFAFAFPAGRVSVDLHLDSRLAERLGYGSAQTISRVSVPIAATFDDVAIDAGGLSRALVWDTVLAAVTLDNASSITASGFDGPLMATLWPDEPGIMRTSAEGTRVPVPTVQSGQASVPLTFRVWSLGKHSTVSPLDWPVHCFVAGILKGR
jgi:hypothetical protein